MVISSYHDIWSSKNSFVSHAGYVGEEYLAPENQINNTYYYNEMDFYRVQNGERKQPDYIMVFKENDEIQYMEQAKKAQEQWGGLPIVVIDKDKCLEREKQKVEEMKKHYELGEKQFAGEIYQKVRNNRVTNNEFCQDINLEEFKQEAEMQKKEENRKIIKQPKPTNIQKQIEIQDLAENYDQVTPQERKDEVSKIRKINAKIQEIVNQKEGEEIG